MVDSRSLSNIQLGDADCWFRIGCEVGDVQGLCMYFRISTIEFIALLWSSEFNIQIHNEITDIY